MGDSRPIMNCLNDSFYAGVPASITLIPFSDIGQIQRRSIRYKVGSGRIERIVDELSQAACGDFQVSMKYLIPDQVPIALVVIYSIKSLTMIMQHTNG